MWRVLKPGGRLAVAVWDALERTPGYAAMTALLQRLFGERIADALRAPFALGDPEALAALAAQAGIPARDHDAQGHGALSLDRGLGAHRRQGLDARRHDR